jgi:hypothetical protein
VKRVKPESAWAAAVAVVLAGFFWFPATDRTALDTFSPSAGGKKAFYTLSQRLLPDVRREVEALDPPEDAGSLVLLGPARYPGPDEWSALHDWVTEGHTLVFVARMDDPAADLGPFGIKVVPRLGSREAEGDEEEADRAPIERPNAPGESSRLEVDPELASGTFDWPSRGWVEASDDNSWTAVRLDGLPQLVYRPIEGGLVVVGASDYLFTNGALVDPDNGLLAFRVLERAAADGALYFNESLNASGAPKVLGLFFESYLRPVTLQLLVGLLLFAWWGSRRFGPPAGATREARRDVTEHAVALGNLYYKVGSGAHSVDSYLDHLRHELRLGYRGPEAEALADSLARRSRIDRKRVVRIVAMARDLGSRPRATAPEAAGAIRALARLRWSVERGDAGHGA